MNKTKAHFYTIIALVLCIIFLLVTQREKPQKPSLEKNEKPVANSHLVKFYEDQTFLQGVTESKKTFIKKNYISKGGIVPHHLLPGFIIADLFNHLAVQKPSTIILLGPNHYEKGDFKTLTSEYGWKTPHGTVEPHIEIINQLLRQNLVRVDEETLPNDHSVAGIMPFVKYYVPDARVVPLLLSGTLTQKESEKLAQGIADLTDDETVIIASVDFSHYLTNEQARIKDETTFQVMKDFDYRTLYTLNSDYLDSPPSIGTLLMTMQKLHATKMDLLFHTNSGELEKDNYSAATSYFSILFYE